MGCNTEKVHGLGDWKKYDEMDVSNRKRKSTDFFLDMPDKSEKWIRNQMNRWVHQQDK